MQQRLEGSIPGKIFDPVDPPALPSVQQHNDVKSGLPLEDQ